MSEIIEQYSLRHCEPVERDAAEATCCVELEASH